MGQYSPLALAVELRLAKACTAKLGPYGGEEARGERREEWRGTGRRRRDGAGRAVQGAADLSAAGWV